MHIITKILVCTAVITLVLSVIAKFSGTMIAGVGPSGYLDATVVALLFGANGALLELLKK